MFALQEKTMESQRVFMEQEESIKIAISAFNKINEFIHYFIGMHSSLGNEFNELGKLKDSLYKLICSLAYITQQSSATTEELASITISQSNATNTIRDMTEKLSLNLQRINDQNKKIKVQVAEKVKNKFAFISDLEHPFWNPAKASVYKAGNMHDVEVSYRAPRDRTHGEEEQVRFLNEAIESGCDGIAISAVESEAVNELLRKAIKNNIKVVCINTAVEGVDYLGVLETNGIGCGVSAAMVAKKLLKNKGKVLVGLWSDVHIKSIEDRAKGFIQEMSKEKDMEVIRVNIPSNPDAKEAENIISDLLRLHPDMDLVFTSNIDWGMNYASYFKKHKIDKKLITVDFLTEIKDYINEGIITTAIAQRPFVWGELSIKWLLDSIEGKSVPKYQDTGTFEVNKSNIKIFEKRFN